MPSFADFKKNLVMKKDEAPAPEHGALLKHVLNLVHISRHQMAKHYTEWDWHDMIFRSEKWVDKADRAAEAKGQPKKMIVPLTFAQVMTFVAFAIMTLTQNRRFFELEPVGTEDQPLTEPLELILERDLRKNKWVTFLVQFFLDIGKFSLGCAEVCYKEDYRYMRVERSEQETGAFGVVTDKQTNEFQKIPTFIGNKVYPVSPYKFLPDTRLPLTRYQEGEFCGSEELFSMASLRSGNEGLFNLDFIPKVLLEHYKDRVKHSRIDLGPMIHENPNLGSDSTSITSGGDTVGGFVKSGPVIITKMVLDIVPKDFKVNEVEGALGSEAFPVRYICWIANDKVIVRFEEATHLHCMFPYICAQYLPDQHRTINEGLADVCSQIQNVVTWLINAHVTSQRQSVQSKWIIDPAGVDVKGLESESPYMFLKKNMSQTGVDKYIKQFITQDVTQGVMGDVSTFKELLENVTGWSGAMQGQYSTGRRSATQDRVVAQGAGARGKCSLASVWDNAFEPLGKQLIANNRQEMDEQTFWRIIGSAAQQQDALMQQTTGMPGVFQLFKADPETIATAEQFFVFDGTLPSEKAFLAQSMQEILMTILSNPEVSGVLGYGPEQVRELFNQIYLLRGVTPARLPAPTPQPPGGQEAGGKPPPAPRELISVGVKDLAGKERDQALAMFGIHADSAAADVKHKRENPPPTSKSNGRTG